MGKNPIDEHWQKMSERRKKKPVAPSKPTEKVKEKPSRFGRLDFADIEDEDVESST